MIGQPLTHAELEQVYGVISSITGRIRHMLQRDSFADHPDLLRGILSLHSKHGLGLDLGRAYTAYFFLIGVSPGSARLLARPQFVEPTLTYGKALVRAGITQDLAPQIVPTLLPSEDPADPGLGHAMSLSADTPLEASGEAGGVLEVNPRTAVETMDAAQPVTEDVAPSSGILPEWIGDHVHLGPSPVGSGDEGMEGVEGGVADQGGGSAVAVHDALSGAVLVTQSSEHFLGVPNGSLTESLVAWPSEQATGRVGMEALVAASQVLSEVQYPVMPHEVTAQETHFQGQEEQGLEPPILPLDSGLTVVPSAVELGVSVPSGDREEAAFLDLEREQASPEFLSVEPQQDSSGELDSTEESDGSLGSDGVFQGATKTDLGVATVLREEDGSGQNGGEEGGTRALDVGQENPDAEGQESELSHALIFPTQEAAVVDASGQEARGWTTDPGLWRMADQMGGTLQKASFPTTGGPHLPQSEQAHGTAQAASEGALMAPAGASRVPIWEEEDRQGHPAEISDYGQLFPDLEGLTLAVEAMQPYFHFLKEMDAYYLQYPDQKGQRSLDDVAVIGQATRSLLDSLGHLSGPDANLFAPEFEAADAALTRLLGNY